MLADYGRIGYCLKEAPLANDSARLYVASQRALEDKTFEPVVL